MPNLADIHVNDLRSQANQVLHSVELLKECDGQRWTQCSNRLLFHCLNSIGGEMERVLEATTRYDTVQSSWATRNLLELTFVVDYLTRSEANRNRFVQEADCDALFLMRTFEEIESKNPAHQPTPAVDAAISRLVSTTPLDCQTHGSRDVRKIARELGREGELDELYKLLSKMSHPTPWSMIGGSNRRDDVDLSFNWQAFGKYLLVLSLRYSAEAILVISRPPNAGPV